MQKHVFELILKMYIVIIFLVFECRNLIRDYVVTT
jgi:hypothetical protein